jgi:gliding motility-associated-like protein
MKSKLHYILLITTVFILFPRMFFAQCGGIIPSFSLGNDTTICEGKSLVLTPGNGFDTYLWNNNSTSATRTVSQAGTYSVTVGQTGGNIITNGDFESGDVGFSTDYAHGTGGTYGLLSTAGQYAISTSPSNVHNNFMSCTDHTSGSGNMLIANGAGTPSTNVWCQTVTVSPNTNYSFSCWLTNALNDANVALLQFYVNGAPIGSIFSPSTSGCFWQKYSNTWNSGALTSVNLCIVNQNTIDSGNDFAIDDISFAPLCLAYDTIVVSTNPTPTISTIPVNPICEGDTVLLQANSTTNGLSYLWVPGSISGQSISVHPATSTVYSVIGTSSLGCASNIASIPVVVNPAPPINIVASVNNLCFGDTVLLVANSTSNNLTYSWTPTASTNDSISVHPTNTTSYSVTATSTNGCENTKNKTISVIQPITVDIQGELTFCKDGETELTATSSEIGTSFTWQPSGNTVLTQTINENNAGWIYLYGNVFNCPNSVDSVFTQALEKPSISVPDDFVVCPGESVDATVTSDQANSTFVWSPLNLTGASNTIYTDVSMTIYVYAQNGNCASPTDSFLISTSAACFLEVPNIFTPNGDLSNDYFKLNSFSGIAALNCTIVNRWGNEMRSFNTPDFMWDGKDKSGQIANEGVYFYILEATTNSGEKLKKQGFIQLAK